MAAAGGTPTAPAFPAESVVASSAGRQWSGLEVFRRRHSLTEVQAPAAPMHLLVVHLRPPQEVTGAIEGGLRLRSFARAPMKLVPAGRSSEWHWRRDRAPSDTLHVFLDPRLVAEAAAASGAGEVEVLDHFGDLDPDIALVGASLQRELAGPGLGDVLYAEAQAQALAVLVLRRHTSVARRAARDRVRGPALLPAPVLQRCVDHVEARLEDPGLTVAELAAVAGYAVPHFTRLFRATTGTPPHRFVIRRRVARARRLLATTDVPVAEVAQRCGFAHQAHLTRHFTRVVGAGPAAYRRGAGTGNQRVAAVEDG